MFPPTYISCDYCCYLRVPFHQLASPPGFHVAHIPKGNLVRSNIYMLSLIHISEPTRQEAISYAVFCLKKKNVCLVCLHPEKLYLYFGHSAVLTRKLRCVARALRCVRGWHRSECERLALSPNFNVKRHRWRENSYAFQVGV